MAGRAAVPRRERGGYTLVELMIVVVILGILAALAIPAYQSYVLRTRAAAGPTMLGAIAVRQDAYYAEFGQYVDVPTTNSGAPGTTPYPGGGDWTGDTSKFTPDAATIKGKSTLWPSPNPTGWATLGFQPDGPVRMGLTTIAGTPGTQPQEMTFSDFWFVAAALADLDDDGTYMTMEISSQTGQVSVDADYE